MKFDDWIVCPESSCDQPQEATVDYEDMGGGQVLLSFGCESCGYGALEDDFRFWVSCPECSAEGDEVDGGVTEAGQIWFDCQECAAEIQGYPSTEWDAE